MSQIRASYWSRGVWKFVDEEAGRVFAKGDPLCRRGGHCRRFLERRQLYYDYLQLALRHLLFFALFAGHGCHWPSPSRLLEHSGHGPETSLQYLSRSCEYRQDDVALYQQVQALRTDIVREEALCSDHRRDAADLED